MKYLIVVDGEVSQVESTELENGALEQFNEGDLLIIRFENGRFEEPVLTSEEVPDNKDDEDGDTHTEYEIYTWMAV